MPSATLPHSLIVPPCTLSGVGLAENLGKHVAVFGRRVMLVHGRSLVAAGRLGRICAGFGAGFEIECYCHTGSEPTLQEVEACRQALRAFSPTCVVAIGGGSVMDLAKAAAGLVNAPLAVRDYHRGAPLPVATLPLVAVPTTAGTGSEATFVAVLSDTDLGIKKSIRDPSHLPRLVVLDPCLLRCCPDAVLAASGMDAFTQAVESYVSRGATWWSDAIALRAAKLVIENLLSVAANRESGDEAYLGLLQGSYLAGLVLSHARLGLVHGLAHPLGYRFHTPHGLVCGICLPHVIRFNRASAAAKYDALSDALGEDILELSERALTELRLSSPFTGKRIEAADAIIAETLASGSTQANPRGVSAADVARMLEGLFR